MKWLKFICSLAVLIFVVVSLNSRLSVGEKTLPPLGKFCDPFHGFWANGESKTQTTLSIPALQDTVTVVWDEREVPHIFAKNERDVSIAQGYLTAKYRLWQMDFLARVASGRLCEVVGSRAKKLDEENRRIGLAFAAESTVAALEKNAPQIKKLLDAYCEGVNAYINSLSYADYPIECKILDYKPEPWSAVKTFLVQKYMAKTLSYRSEDREMNNIVAAYDRETMENLFPLKNSASPIIPSGTPWKFNPRGVKDDKNAQNTNEIYDIPFSNRPDMIKGSNNWAVSGKKTLSGRPMLSNDPHLRLFIPAIWLEMQLHSPELNVYGVTIPGLPGIVIGFNENVAWGVTNSVWDVLDWYKIKYKSDNKDFYWFDDKWLPTTKRREVIKIRGEEDYVFDVVYTHHGPVSFDEPVSMALRWTAHDPSLEFKAFYLLNRAKNYNDYRKALEYYDCPAQNFVFADASGDIAITPNGKFPIKPQGLGRVLEDGTTSSTEWKDYVPFEHKPHIKNPESGFVSSANQHPTDDTYPYYYNGRFEYYRNVRINERLAEMQKITVKEFNDLLNDNYNVHASTVLPTLLKMVKGNSDEEKLAMEILQKWDYNNDAHKIAPSIFYEWWRSIIPAVWDEFGDGKKYTKPSWHRTVEIIVQDPRSKWFDNVSTEKQETVEELVQETFVSAIRKLSEVHGTLDKDNAKWQWGNHRGCDVSHMMNIAAFSQRNLFVGGGRHIVNATRKNAGPSWRMVVELTTPVRAWGVYPGGQSGNPGSKHYDDFIDRWEKGELYELLFLSHPQDRQEKCVRKLIIGVE